LSENFKDRFDQDLSDTLKGFLDKKIREDRMQFYTGKIEDVQDPEQLGRCKIRVYGIFEESIPTSDLPWAKPDFNFIGSTLGSFIVPKVDTLVKVYFDDGDIYSPFYTTKVFNRKNLSTIPGEDYPNIMLFFETDEGDSFYINRVTFETFYTHASGLTIKIDAKGNISMESNDAEKGDLSIVMKGDISITSETGNVSIQADAGKILLGGSAATRAVPNVPTSFFNGAPLAISQNLPGVPGATYIRP